MPKTLEVVGRPLTYATRRMMPGDTFSASDRDARVLIAVKRARERRELAKLPPPPPGLAVKAKKPGITDLRKQYQDKFGKRAFNGWDAETLAKKIAEA